MKIIQTITLDLDVVMELKKERNKSKLINDFLRDYFELDNKQIKEKAELSKEEKEILN